MVTYEPHVITRFQVDSKEAQQKMELIRDTWIDTNKVLRDGTTISKTQQKLMQDGTKVTRELRQETTRFKSEYLTLMFAGMGIERMFSGQIDRVETLVGKQAVLNAFYTQALIEPSSKVRDLTISVLEALGWLGDPPEELGWAMYTVKGIGTTLKSIALMYMGLVAVDTVAGTTLASSLGKLGGAFVFKGSVLAGSLGSLGGIIFYLTQDIESLLDLLTMFTPNLENLLKVPTFISDQIEKGTGLTKDTKLRDIYSELTQQPKSKSEVTIHTPETGINRMNEILSQRGYGTMSSSVEQHIRDEGSKVFNTLNLMNLQGGGS